MNTDIENKSSYGKLKKVEITLEEQSLRMLANLLVDTDIGEEILNSNENIIDLAHIFSELKRSGKINNEEFNNL